LVFIVQRLREQPARTSAQPLMPYIKITSRRPGVSGNIMLRTLATASIS
jgi:hypothetical protein